MNINAFVADPSADNIDVDPHKNDNIYDRYTNQLNKNARKVVTQTPKRTLTQGSTTTTTHALISGLPQNRTNQSTQSKIIPARGGQQNHRGSNTSSKLQNNDNNKPVPSKINRVTPSAPKRIFKRSQPISSVEDI